jgi:glutathione synthase/RimK-type ligase-like ATP-grasp enzyme
MIDKKGNPYVLEVNASPGTDGIEKISGIPVTEMVIDYIQDKNN